MVRYHYTIHTFERYLHKITHIDKTSRNLCWCDIWSKDDTRQKRRKTHRQHNIHNNQDILGWLAAEYFIRFCFCLWLQNHTLTTFFFKSSFSAMAAIFSPDGRGWTAKYASRDRFSGAAMDVLFLFLSEEGRTLINSRGSPLLPARLFRAWASAASSHAWRIGFRATMLLCDRVRDSKRQIVDCESDPTPGNFRLARALPTSACVTPSLMRRCLNFSAKASNSLGSASSSPDGSLGLWWEGGEEGNEVWWCEGWWPGWWCGWWKGDCIWWWWAAAAADAAEIWDAVAAAWWCSPESVIPLTRKGS